MLIAQLSDPHLVASGQLLYGKVDTARALAAAVDRVNALVPQVDLTVLSGDLVNAGRAEEYEHLSRQLARLTRPWYLLPGNHDERTALRAAFPEQAFSGAPLLCQRLDLADLTLLLLDTVVPGEEGGEFGQAQKEWLATACPADRAVLLFLHHPPFLTGITGMDSIRLAGAGHLARWLEGRHNIRALASGHVHRTVFSTFAGIPAMIAPSTAHQIALALDTGPGKLGYALEPGGFLLHRWDGQALATHVVPVDMATVHAYE